MRGVKALIAGTALLTALIATAQPSLAEGLLRRLFGGIVERLPEYRFNFGRMGPSGYGSDDAYDGGSWQEDYGSYRTLCVRLCDGFYFPISDGVRRERLNSDAHQCAQRCDGEARLFYYPTAGGSVETMVDLTGRRYADLPNAFRYRKSLVNGCACKPAPWSPQEAARHQGYAAQAAQGAEPPVEDARRTAPATREASRSPSPYDEPPRVYGRGPQTPWDPDHPGARPSWGWDHD
ncbi:MAG TPA: DUF2865 domain-containing protein [Hyphomicrobium sp.]|nr:DUF2865 domain-containing protein [Hyphomicrobium sp.]